MNYKEILFSLDNKEKFYMKKRSRGIQKRYITPKNIYIPTYYRKRKTYTKNIISSTFLYKNIEIDTPNYCKYTNKPLVSASNNLAVKFYRKSKSSNILPIITRMSRKRIFELKDIYKRKYVSYNTEISFKNFQKPEFKIQELTYKVPILEKLCIIINMRNVYGLENIVMRLKSKYDIVEIYSNDKWIFEMRNKKYNSKRKLIRMTL